MAARKEIARELSIYINDRQVINSLGGVTREITRVNGEMRNLNKNSATYDQDLKKLQTTLSSLKDNQSDFKDEIQATGQVAGDAKEKIAQIFLGLATGNLKLVQEGLSGIKGSIQGMTQSALAFISTPIGAAIAAIAGIGIGTKAIFDFNAEAEKSAVLLENLTGKTGKVVEDIRIKMKSLTDTFGVEFNSLANAVDNLVDTGAVKDEFQALELIKNGLLTAPDKNEFIASLESSAVAAKNIGASLEEVIAIKQQIEETGVDPEKSFGAYQKAANNLALQSDKLREKLSGALGASFTDEILAKIKTGQITTVQALDAIGKKSKEVGLNQTQQAEIGKELFGKAGIAAGGFAILVDNISKAEARRNIGLNANQTALKELADANEKVNKAQSELFRVENFGSIWTAIKAKVLDAIGSILQYIADIKTVIQPLIDLVGITFANVWYVLKTSVGVVFDYIGGVLKVFSNTVSTVFNFVKKIFTGDFQGAIDVLKQGFLNFGKIVDDTFNKIKNSVISGLQSILQNVKPFLEALGIPVDTLIKKLESFKSKEVNLKVNSSAEGDTKAQEVANTKATAEELAAQAKIRAEAREKEKLAREKATEDKKKEQEKAAKEELERAIALAKALSDLAKSELNYFISQNATKLISGQKLTQDLLDQEIKRLYDIKFAKENELGEERLRQIKNAEQTAKSADELAVLKQTIDLNYLTAQQNLDLEFQSSTDVLKKQYETEQAQLKLDQLTADNELALLEGANKDEVSRIKQEQDYQSELLRYKKLLDDKKITEEEYSRFKAAAKQKQDDLDNIKQIAQVQATIVGISSLANAAGQLFGQSKELALAQAAINGAQGITSILAQWPKFDGGFSMYAAIAATILTTAASVKEITKQKAPKTPKFYYGGFTGNSSALGNDQYGPVTGVVHQNEWVAPEVMTRSPKYAATFSWLENERKEIMSNKYFEGGNVTANNGNASTNDYTPELLNMLSQLNSQLNAGIKATANIGYQEAQGIQTLNQEIKNSSNNATLNQ